MACVVLIIAADFLSTVLVANTSVHLGWFPLFCILLALVLLIALADIRISTRIQLVFAAIGVLAIVALSLAIVAKGGANGLTWRPFDPGVSPSGHGLALAVILALRHEGAARHQIGTPEFSGHQKIPPWEDRRRS